MDWETFQEHTNTYCQEINASFIVVTHWGRISWCTYLLNVISTHTVRLLVANTFNFHLLFGSDTFENNFVNN